MPLTLAQMMASYDKTIESVAGEIDRVFSKQWEARADVIRNVVSIAAVIFAGTITLLEKNPPRIGTAQGLFLIVSWLSLLASIFAGLFVLWKSVALRRFHAMLVNKKPHLQTQLANLNLTAPNIVQQSVDIIKAIADEATQSVGRADSHSQVGTGVCLTAFGMSMLCFLAYALAKLGVFCN